MGNDGQTLVDLHAHSTASDGTDTPAELVRVAHDAGVDVLAITDHDSTAGWADAVRALPPGMSLVRGMEMSCTGRGEDGRSVAVHLLAYLFDPAEPSLAAERARLRGERDRRLRAMITRMSDDGYPVDADSILAAAGPAAGRPHLAAALVAEGVVSSVDEAFSGLLAPRSKYVVPKRDTQLSDAVTMVRDAGGVTVLAHGRARKRGRILAVDHIEEAAALGMAGLEVDHVDHSADDRAFLAGLARTLKLVITGSSDYHGTHKTVPIAANTTVVDQYERLVAAATGIDVVHG